MARSYEWHREVPPSFPCLRLCSLPRSVVAHLFPATGDITRTADKATARAPWCVAAGIGRDVTDCPTCPSPAGTTGRTGGPVLYSERMVAGARAGRGRGQ